MRVSSTALRHVRELEIHVVVEFLSVVPVLWCLTHHTLELHRLNEIRVPFRGFRVHVPDLALAHDVLYLNFVFVRSCPRVFPLCVFSSVEFLIWHSLRISFVFTLNVVSSFSCLSSRLGCGSNLAFTALLVLRTSSTVNSRLLFNLLHPSNKHSM